jgi:hypothetical protein
VSSSLVERERERSTKFHGEFKKEFKRVQEFKREARVQFKHTYITLHIHKNNKDKVKTGQRQQKRQTHYR